MGCDIGYGYLHRIPISVDCSKPTVRDGSNDGSQTNVNIAAVGSTGIPQIDQIQHHNGQARQFPDPNEFALPPAVSQHYSSLNTREGLPLIGGDNEYAAPRLNLSSPASAAPVEVILEIKNRKKLKYNIKRVVFSRNILKVFGLNIFLKIILAVQI